ncbi:unnamed protein product [Adineta ricciae]|uniref:LEM domain-containing protein n=1 Tax=Adineta ricciae TaxID=249248 RepID=A0A814NZ87_ADIRI|nr:unnamed protein product [Adineta ricciae]CAF1096913.1 unnamed protein product [Adineta ricciae]
MALKAELHDKLKSLGYELGPFASKDTLSAVLCLHSVVMTQHNINVAKINDLELRRQLMENGLKVGPVTKHTRAIYQRKLLEVLTQQSTECQDDEVEIEEPVVRKDYETKSLYPNIYDTKSSNYSKKDDSPIIRNNYKPTKDFTSRNTFEEVNEIRSRLPTKPTEVKKSSLDDNQAAVTKNSGSSTFYVGIALFVAIIVFFGYLWLEK